MFDGGISSGRPGRRRQSTSVSRNRVTSGRLEQKSPGSVPPGGVYHMLSSTCEVRRRMARYPAGCSCVRELSSLLRQRYCGAILPRYLLLREHNWLEKSTDFLLDAAHRLPGVRT